MTESSQRPLEIGKEYPPPGEDAATEKLRQFHLKIHHAEPGPNRRGEHPKQHGGVWARFRVEEEIPKEFRVGLFEKPGNYIALVWSQTPYKFGEGAVKYLATPLGEHQKFNSPEQMSFVENLHWTPFTGREWF